MAGSFISTYLYRMKDLFSSGASEYARFRPQYPDALFDYVLSFVPGRQQAWDAGCGNGQTAFTLSRYFEAVLATDISAEQLAQAPLAPNIQYKTESSGTCSLPDQSADLITVSQALHWFQPDDFYREVKRVARANGWIAAWGYNLIRINPAIDAAVDALYTKVLGSYWDAERRHIDQAYAQFPFPFSTIPDPGLYIEDDWLLPQLEGYLRTWSAWKHYRRQHPGKPDPVTMLLQHLKADWPLQERLPVRFPLFLKMGRVFSN